ncbi:Vms1/Ankzf1 family peptidyl-tRNA hydrolase [Streptomyces sp. V1I1]|uniref:baeRF2 domain-containing protein n=1 Tax=Streptomyces sp. V1I1 TaxID=3042272 RepID=UPI002781FB04|nr:Vms1/Ankzf1 family peptidyl-tRNA hydrolase [Streptomyces sp. V1I1]MDQ0945363.1 hypothetical protein [Streptomyces sp. V1I1]
MQLAFLAPLYERPGPWASVHLDTTWTDESTPSRRQLQVTEACRKLALQGADEATGRAMYEALTTRPHYPGESGRAVFATGGEVVLDPPLAHRPSAASDVSWSALPHVAPLLDLAVQEPVCLVAYIDRTGADLELRSPLGSRAVGQAQGKQWSIHRTTGSHWSASHHPRSVENTWNTWDHNAGEIAAAIAANQEDCRADLVVLAGGLRERRAVHNRLPIALRPRVVETDHGGRADGPATRLLDEDVEQSRQDHLNRRAEEELDRFRAAPAATAEGIPALVDAAREHRIAELFIRPEGPDAHHEVWVGIEPEQLAVRRTDLQYLGEPHPSSARADDALLRCAAVTGAEALRVPSQGHDDVPVGGLGALLRQPYDDRGRHPRMARSHG